MNNRTIVISGATKGLGRAIAEHFAQNGFDVAACARTETDLLAMQTHWEKSYPNSKLHLFTADFSKKESVLEFAAFVQTVFPITDILVNNAGVFLPGQITEEPDGHLEKMMEINVYSAYYLTRALLPHLKAGSHIFNMASVAGLKAYPGGGSYSITKFALMGFSKVLREELKPRNIRVTTLIPGAAWSDSWKGVDLPQSRLMQASDIAKTVWAAWDLSDAAVMEEVILRPFLGDL